ncbi:mitochondrial sodium/calcium exchanger protein-like [Ochlerotatus camptorhynchus]|uniref:mitochondrial sodium/calcium exchanger protein-like n=1 Tax=Ochlerotatus camptorhynchus TaxID=644619 RepID=UPI0031D55CEB
MSSFAGNISHREPRHASFLSFAKPLDCNYIHQLNSSEKCNFVKTTESCRENVFYFDYTYFLFCTIGEEDRWQFDLGIALLVFILLIFFTVLATTADQFFCPVLAVIAKTFRISESVAGVTILAFGNGSPDLFTAINNPHSDTELMFGELLGAGMFVIGVVAGTILIIRPFQLNSAAIVRDVIFFIFSVAWISGCAFDQRFSLSDAIVVVVIYVVYLIVVVIDFFVLKHRFQEAESQLSLTGEIPDSDSYYNELRGEAEMVIRSPTVGSELDISKTRISVFQNVHQRRPPRNHYLFIDFLEHISPIDRAEWNGSTWFCRMLTILKAPVMFVLLLIIPIMDYTAERHGWTKLLNILHWLTLPMVTLGVSGSFFDTVLNCPAWAWLLICSSSLMTVLFCTSRTDRPPRYHLAYALLAFVGSIQVIYVVAQEVVCLLVTLGLVLKLSKSMLGLSVLAWGNSIGDLFSNITLANRGYGKMAFAACLGGPLFNLCLGLGITMILKASAAVDNVAFSREGALGENCEWFLVQLLYTLLFVLLLSDFQGRQSTGVVLITIYVIFFLFCLLGELEVIHPFGTDHYDEYV